MNYEAEINAHDLRHIDPEPRFLGILSSDDLQKLMIKVGGVCVAFDRKHKFKGFNLTVTVRGMQ